MEHKITRLGHQGDGVAEGPIYAPRCLPDEVVTGDLNGQQLEKIRIVTPSPNRVRPPCPAYQRCGGCALMHASDDFVAGWKGDIVVSALSAQGIEARIRHVHTSPPQTRRRAKLTGKRTKNGAIVGFYGRASHTVVPIDGCAVLIPALMDMRPALEELTTRLASRKHVLEFHLLACDTGIDLAVEGAKQTDPNLAQWAKTAGIARLSVNGELVALRSQPVLNIGLAAVIPPPMGFAQATVAGERALQNGVDEALQNSTHVVDLFAGFGTLGLPLAARAGLDAVEGSPDLIAALDHGVRQAQGLKPVTTQVRDLFRNPLLPDELAPFDGAIIDPPRAGAQAQVTQLAQSGIHDIAMVSCNPITFARDIAILQKHGYKPAWIDVVDQFRWSPHIEIVAHVKKEGRG